MRVPAADPATAPRQRPFRWLIATAVVVSGATAGPLLVALLLAELGCGNREVATGPGCVLTIVIEKEFVKHLSAYQPWPDLDGMFGHAHAGSGGNFCDPRGVVAFFVLAIPVVVVAEVTGLTYHNLHGVQIAFTVSVDGGPPPVAVSADLHWGENRVVIPESALAPLIAGTAVLHVDVLGTREVHLRMSSAGLEWMRAGHGIVLAADGRLLVDGQAVEVAEAMVPEPAPKLGPLRGRL